MELSVNLGVDVRCVTCGRARDLPDSSERVVESDGVLYAESAERCLCGSRSVRIRTIIGSSPHR
jgi:hypothetical protein